MKDLTRALSHYQELNDTIKELTKQKDDLKKEFSRILHTENTLEIISDDCKLEMQVKLRTTLDKKAVEKELGADWIDANSKRTTYEAIIVKKINKVA